MTSHDKKRMLEIAEIEVVQKTRELSDAKARVAQVKSTKITKIDNIRSFREMCAYKLLNNGMKLKDVAKMFEVSGSRVRELASKYKRWTELVNEGKLT